MVCGAYMAGKLNDAEIDKLRAIVGMGEEASPMQTASALAPQVSAPQALSPKPRQTAAREERRNEADFDAPQAQVPPANLDTSLFVKIEEHAALGSILLKTKTDMKSIADTISLLARAEKLKADAIERMEKVLDIIDSNLDDLELKLAPPEGLSVPEFTGQDNSAMSDNMIDLHSELESLKNELMQIR